MLPCQCFLERMLQTVEVDGWKVNLCKMPVPLGVRMTVPGINGNGWDLHISDSGCPLFLWCMGLVPAVHFLKPVAPSFWTDVFAFFTHLWRPSAFQWLGKPVLLKVFLPSGSCMDIVVVLLVGSPAPPHPGAAQTWCLTFLLWWF